VSETNAETPKSVSSNRYPLPLYLNQKYVFDVLSMMEKGFTQLETVTSRSAEQRETGGEATGGVGFSNVFGLLNVSFGGSRVRKDQTQDQHEVSTQRVHTPNSLFARMRERLFQENLVRETLSGEGLSPGDFVEITARLEKNPLIESLETLVSILNMALIFEDRPSQVPSQRKEAASRRPPTSENARVLEQVKELVEVLRTGEIVDLLAAPVEMIQANVILTLDMTYAADPSLSDLIDGEYRVLGKITRSIPVGSDESINLLRKTSLGRLHASVLDGLKAPLEEMQTEGINLPSLKTEIEAPVIQILPIAVFA
jgi:hypothetical protein